jgi:hypothetical protein
VIGGLDRQPVVGIMALPLFLASNFMQSGRPAQKDLTRECLSLIYRYDSI